MTRIYGLYTEQMCWYIGRTEESLGRRARNHRTVCNEACSKDIPKDFEWDIRLIEECSIENRIARERYWIEELKPFYNRYRPGQTKAEYMKTEDYKVYKKEYYQTDAYKEYKKAYYQRKKAIGESK